MLGKMIRTQFSPLGRKGFSQKIEVILATPKFCGQILPNFFYSAEVKFCATNKIKLRSLRIKFLLRWPK